MSRDWTISDRILWCIETIAIGAGAALVFALIGGLIYGLIVGPVIFLEVVGGLIALLGLGQASRLTYEAYQKWEFNKEHKTKNPVEEPYVSKYQNTTLQLLDQFEYKYRIGTFTLMELLQEDRFVPIDPINYRPPSQRSDYIIGKIDPLDLVTWVGLINSISEIIQTVPKPVDREEIAASILKELTDDIMGV